MTESSEQGTRKSTLSVLITLEGGTLASVKQNARHYNNSAPLQAVLNARSEAA